MKTITVFILLASLLVDARPAYKSNRHLLLRQIISEAHELQKELEHRDFAETYVDAGFSRERCECQDFYIAKEILIPILTEHSGLPRALYAYFKGNNQTTRPRASEADYHLKALVEDIIHCAQVHMHEDHKHCPNAGH